MPSGRTMGNDYFLSHGAAGQEVYRCPATGGDAVALRVCLLLMGLYPLSPLMVRRFYFTSVGAIGKSALYAVSMRKLGTKVALKEIPVIDHAAF